MVFSKTPLHFLVHNTVLWAESRKLYRSHLIGFVDGDSVSHQLLQLLQLLKSLGFTVVWNNCKIKETGWGDKLRLAAIVREPTEAVSQRIKEPFEVEFEGQKFLCVWQKDERPQRKYRNIVHLWVAICLFVKEEERANWIKRFGDDRSFRSGKQGVEWVKVPFEGFFEKSRHIPAEKEDL